MAEIKQIMLTKIKPDPQQPRRTFDVASLNELAQSIKAHGVLQPIEVSRNGDECYHIHHGERRWRASMYAGCETIPAVIVEPLTESVRFMRAVIENEQREDMRPMDKAAAYRRLIDEFGYTRMRIAREVGKSQPYVDNLLRWSEAEPEIQQMVNDGRLPTDGRVREALFSLPEQARVMMADRLTKNGKPSIKTVVIACEKLAAKVASAPASASAPKEKPESKKRQVFPPALTLLVRQPADSDGITWLTIKNVAQQQCSSCPAWMPGDDTLICRQCPLALALGMMSEGVGA